MNPKQKLLLGAVICGAVVGSGLNADLRAADSAPAFKVVKHGHGSPVILIPGLGSSGSVWDSTLPALEGKHECHVLTLAGFAGQAPISKPLIEQASEELAAYIKEQKLKKPAVIGHSLGGVMTLYLAEKHGGALGPIVMVDCLPALGMVRGTNADEVKAGAEATRKEMEAQPKEEFQAQIKGFLTMMVADDEGKKKVGDWMVASDQKTVAGCFAWIIGTDLRPDLPKIKNRALLLEAGVMPGGVPEDVFKAQYAGLKGLKMARDPKSKHFIMFDDPEFLNGQLKEFLDR